MTAHDMTAALGRRMLKRAAVPGVIRPDLSERIQRRFPAGGLGLANAIRGRWLPATPESWGGEGLPYFGSGRSGAPADVGFASSGPVAMSRPTPATPARTVGAATNSPAVRTLSDLGSRLQRRHLGVHESGVVQRKALTAVAFSPRSRSAEGPRTPRAPIDSHAGSQGFHRAPVPRADRAQVSAGQVQMQRTTPASGEIAQAQLPKPLPKSPQVGQSAPSTARSTSAPLVQRRLSTAMKSETESVEPIAEMGPAIVHHAARTGSVQRRSLAPMGTEAIRANVSERINTSTSLPILTPTHQETQGMAIQRTAAKAAETGANLPLVQPQGLATLHREAESVSPGRSANSPVQRLGPLLPPLPLAPPSLEAVPGNERLLSEAMTTTLLLAQANSGMQPGKEDSPGTERSSAAITPTAGLGPLLGISNAAAGSPDPDELAERVMRRLTRSLAVEFERHGGRRWP